MPQHNEPEIQIAKPMLLPPPAGHCRICAVKHDPLEAHNAQSVFYQMRFRMRYGRDGTWADAIAHLPSDIAEQWRTLLGNAEAWTQPPDGVDPIPEPIDG
jgi:hypothetical protein